jgi:RNA polymerase sigma-70 factor, ECF subfamily
MSDFQEQLSAQRSHLLRHCYRMLGSFPDAEDLVQDTLLNAWRSRDTYAGTAPLGHWLMRIATNACLNALESQRRRGLPQLDHAAIAGDAPIGDAYASLHWITPAPDAQLLANPATSVETRESIALAFIALLQRLPPRQRAVFLLKDILGWSVAEIESGLEMSNGAVSSALHRARESVALPAPQPHREPEAATIQAYLRTWEQHDVAGMLTLLRDDITFAMPPFAAWFHGRAQLESFLRSPLFSERWSGGFRVLPTRANGEPAFAFYHGAGTGYRASSVQVVRFVDDAVAEIIAFLGPQHFRGFGLPESID